MTRIVLQGKKVYDTFENESVQEIMELHMKAQDYAAHDIVMAEGKIRQLLKENSELDKEGQRIFYSFCDKKQLKEIDKLAKSIRDNIKFLTAEYTLVDGGETYKIGEEK